MVAALLLLAKYSKDYEPCICPSLLYLQYSIVYERTYCFSVLLPLLNGEHTVSICSPPVNPLCFTSCTRSTRLTRNKPKVKQACGKIGCGIHTLCGFALSHSMHAVVVGLIRFSDVFNHCKSAWMLQTQHHYHRQNCQTQDMGPRVLFISSQVKSIPGMQY